MVFPHSQQLYIVTGWLFSISYFPLACWINRGMPLSTERIRTLSLVRLFSGIAVQLAASLEMFKPPLLFGAENQPAAAAAYVQPQPLPDDTLNAAQVINTILDALYYVGNNAGANYGMNVLFAYCSVPAAGVNAIRNNNGEARTPKEQYDHYWATTPYQALFTHECARIFNSNGNDYVAILRKGNFPIVVATFSMQPPVAAGAAVVLPVPNPWMVNNMTLD